MGEHFKIGTNKNDVLDIIICSRSQKKFGFIILSLSLPFDVTILNMSVLYPYLNSTDSIQLGSLPVSYLFKSFSSPVSGLIACTDT